MIEMLSFSLMFFTFFSLVYLISHISSAAMQQYLSSESAILNAPAKLIHTTDTRTHYFLFCLLPLYGFAVYHASNPMELIGNWIFITFMIFISIMDFEQQVILDKVLVLICLFAFLFTPFLEASLLNRLLAAVLGSGVLLFLAILTKGAIGGGDIKLLLILGLWLGMDKLLLTLLYGFIAGGIVSGILLLLKLKMRHDKIAYGPYFALSAIYLFLS